MFVPRDLTEKFIKINSVYTAIAIVGPRQAGKTTFLKEMMKKYKSSYILFDDPDARALFEDIKKFKIQYLSDAEIGVLDEVQYCKNAGINLKYLIDTGAKLWITSSSEILLSKEILSYLVGRISILRLYPFNLNEFMRAKNQREYNERILKRIIWEHATYGGYPRVVLTEDAELKKIILRDLFDTMLLKDVARNFSIDDYSSLERLAKYLAINTGQILSYSNVSKILALSFSTLKKYIDALEKSYLVIRISPFFSNKSNEIRKQPKIYFIDTGLRNAIINSYPDEVDGSLFENYVLCELIKMDLKPRYWRTKSKAEVDFIIDNKEIIPIEVKLKSTGKIERGLRSFIEKYRVKRAFVVFYEGIKEEKKIGNTKIYFTDVIGLRKYLQSLQKL